MVPLSWLDIEESQIRRCKYEPNKHDARGNLLVEFVEGKTYRFVDIPFHKVEYMVHSSSPGTYFHNNIRGQYDSVRVDE